MGMVFLLIFLFAPIVLPIASILSPLALLGEILGISPGALADLAAQAPDWLTNFLHG